MISEVDIKVVSISTEEEEDGMASSLSRSSASTSCFFLLSGFMSVKKKLFYINFYSLVGKACVFSINCDC